MQKIIEQWEHVQTEHWYLFNTLSCNVSAVFLYELEIPKSSFTSVISFRKINKTRNNIRKYMFWGFTELDNLEKLLDFSRTTDYELSLLTFI